MSEPAKPPVVPAPTATPTPKMVEADRFKAVVRDRDEWKGRYEAEIQPLAEKAARVDTLLDQIDKIKGEHRTAAAAWAEERGLLSAGVTDAEDVELVRFHYGRVPTETRPKSIGEYVTGLKAEGASVPKGLAHLFGRPAADPAAGGPPKNGTPPIPPRASGDGRPPPTGGAVTAEAIRRATEAWQRTGTADARATLETLMAAASAARS